MTGLKMNTTYDFIVKLGHANSKEKTVTGTTLTGAPSFSTPYLPKESFAFGYPPFHIL